MQRLLIILSLSIGLLIPTKADTLHTNIDPETLAQIERKADLGDTSAQQQLVVLYLADASLIRDQEWFDKLLVANAFEQHLSSQLALAEKLEALSLTQPAALDLAIAMYGVIEEQSPEARAKYYHLLERKFNDSKKAQLANLPTIEINDSEDEQTIDEDRDSSIHLWLSYLVIGFLSLGLIATITILKRARDVIKSIDHTGLQQQIASQKEQISRQTQQLKKAQRLITQYEHVNHREPQQKAYKVASATPDKRLLQACRIFGYTPKTIPSPEEIKRQYKKLSHRFHPDRHGDSEKMKSINTAFTLLIKHHTEKA
ncbi:J domain-containing protein [Vibrio astriarenae]|uniref:J domain-containing protein n=1 Tax=Vibrio astriarenae TaxID=1481923 RepID=UPI003736E521